MKASKIAKIIEEEAPLALAESWDNPGFQIGSAGRDVKTLMSCLDLDQEALDYALDNEVDMIVSHHPLFFKGIKRIDNDTRKGKIIEEIIKNDLIVYSAHTNLDKAENGLNTFVARMLGLENIRPLDVERENFYKFAVYVPETHSEEIFEELVSSGIGKTGDKYQSCSFQTSGTGSFEALEGANPALGEVGKLESVKEVKLETLIRKDQIPQVLNLLNKIHPYEEYAYDLIAEEIYTKRSGLGSIGKLVKPESSEAFLKRVLNTFDVQSLREAGPRPERIKKVALCTGAGAEFIQKAKYSGADVYLTGDLKHHDAQRAEELGLWVLDIGHFETEKFVTELFEKMLSPSGLKILQYRPDNGFIKTVFKN